MQKITALFIFFTSYTATSQLEYDLNEDYGVYLIPCKVNGVPLEFIFDTGASNVSISITEAKFLLKNGLLDEYDIKGNVRYQIANGEIKEGTKINLKEIDIEGYIIQNVDAQIVYEQSAPLLLGMSALNKVGRVVIENEILKIYPKSDIFSKEKIFKNTKKYLKKALSHDDEKTYIYCTFKKNFLGIHTITKLEEPDYDYHEPSIDVYEKMSKEYALYQAKTIMQNNQVYLKRIENSGIEIISFMYDYDLLGKKTKLLYGVASKKLIELGNELDKEKFENILIRL
jgi:clan AA aspartic protease (TIGR02281 family)